MSRRDTLCLDFTDIILFCKKKDCFLKVSQILPLPFEIYPEYCVTMLALQSDSWNLLNGTVEQTDFGSIVQADGNSGDRLAQGPRHAGVPAGPKAVGDMEPSCGQPRGAKASASKESWLPHTTGPPTKACPGSAAASHLKALRLGTAPSLKSHKFACF